jgi:type IV pilus assembly protein PilX
MRAWYATPRERGMALLSSLLLLAVVTILAVGMFRTLGIEEQIAGNLREKERALHAAETAQQYAEWWLSNIDNSSSPPVVCNSVLNANLGQGQICSNKLTSVTSQPLQINGVDVGVTINPGNSMNVTTTRGRDTYYRAPRFYIADIGPSAAGDGGEIYQIDAVGYGSTPTAVAVVESTFEVMPGGARGLGGL